MILYLVPPPPGHLDDKEGYYVISCLRDMGHSG